MVCLIFKSAVCKSCLDKENKKESHVCQYSVTSGNAAVKADYSLPALEKNIVLQLFLTVKIETCVLHYILGEWDS